MKNFLCAGILALVSIGGAWADSVVVFNEIHYHPDASEPAREYVELHNQMAVDVDLSGWRIAGGVDYAFPNGTIIPGRGFLVVAASPAGVQAAYGVAGALGPWEGRLSNSGEELRLRDNSDREMDSVAYGTDGKWPAGADGAGPSLSKANSNSASSAPTNWTLSFQHGGTPGAANFADPNAPFVPPAGLVSWWRMDEATGATTADTVGGNIGTLGSGATRVAGLTGNGAIGFDNTTNAFVNAGSGGSLTVTTGLTIEALIRSTWNGTGVDVLYSKDNTAPPTNLAAYYPFDEAASGTAAAVDTVGGPNGTFIGTAARTAGLAGTTGAAHFNNVGADGVSIGTGLSFSTGLTIVARIKSTWNGVTLDYDEIFRKEDGNNRILLSFQRDGNNGGASPPVTTGPVLSFGLNTAGVYRELDMPLDGAAGRPTLAELTNGSTHHVAATYDAATGVKAIYIDGTLRWSTTHSGNIVSGGGATAVIGNTGPGGGEPFAGDIDDFALFRVALTAAQIQNLANGTNTPLDVLPGSGQIQRVLFALQNDGSNGAANPPVAAGPVLSFGLNTGGTYSELDMPLDGATGRPTLAQLTDGATHHLAATYDAATGVKAIYMDGTLRFSTTLSGSIASSGAAPATLGNSAPNGPDAFSGTLDEVAYWSRALNSAEVSNHWAKTQTGADYFAPQFSATPPPSLRLNEVGVPGGFFLELQNTGATPLNLGGYVVRITGVGGGQFVLPAQGLAPGALLSLTSAQLGLAPALGAKVFVLTTGGAQHVDSIEVAATARARTTDGSWAYASAATPGAANTFAFRNEIVINEIMYRPRPIPGSAAVTQSSTLIPLTATWKYRDDGQDLGTAWRSDTYIDSTWPAGAGMFASATGGGSYATAVLADAPIAYWKLDDATASIADASGNGRTGSATAGVQLGTAALVSDGAASRAITLAGSNRVTVPGFEKIGAGGYSVEFWVKVLTAPGGFMNLVGDGDSAGDFFLMNYLTPGMLIRPHYGPSGTVSLDSLSSLSTGPVYHVVTTWNPAGGANNGVIYINGVADRSGTVSATVPIAGTTGNNTIYIGYDNREPASGSYVLDEVALYNFALSPTRVAAHFGAGALPSPRNTTLAAGPATHYFRTTFNFTGNPAATELFLNLATDDGAVVYLNGVEIVRDNMPGSAITFGTPAASERTGVTLSGAVSVPAGALRTGMNVLAVEVHQAASGSSDVFMGLELTALETLSPALIPAESTNSWLELHNRSAASVNLTGWRLDDGVDFHFAAGTTIPAGGYLVVANDLPLFQAAHPGVTAVGPLLNRLSRGGERVLLRDPAGNVADAVTYYDSGRWPSAADGGGSSLELRDRDADNDAAEAWAASDESSRASWQTYTYRGVAAADGGPTNWNEFVLGLLDEGEVLLDDLHVISQPGTASAAEIVTGGDLESGAGAWRMLGTHRTSAVIAEPGNASNHVLRITSTGGTDVIHNHIETTMIGNTAIVNGREYEISFRAKWVRGIDLLNTRLYWNRVAKVTRLATPANGGTPGAANSRSVANLGPTFTGLRHAPVVPAAAQACVISVEAADPDNVNSATLFYDLGGGNWQSVPMSAAGATWSGTIPGQSAGAVVQFYVRATDGPGATADFPAAGPAARALIQWNNGQANLPLAHNVRLILTAADNTLLFTNTNLLADDRVGATVVYDESEVFYDAAVRLKGSEHGRADTGRQSYNVRFSPEHKFRGVHDSVMLDRSGGWRSGATFGQDEILVKHIISHAGGVASLQDDIVRLITPQSGHTGPALLQMARYGQDYLDSMYQDGADGQLYKMEIAYHSTGTDNGLPTGLKTAQEGSISNVDLGDRGTDPESYRWFFRHENNTAVDEFAPIMGVNRAFALSGSAFDAAIDPLIDNDQWMRCLAFESLCGITDIFTRDNGHNVNFYLRPKDEKILALPWDWDFAFMPAMVNGSLFGGRATSKLVQRPHNLRVFYAHLQDIMATTFNTTYMARWTDHYDNFTPGQNYSGILTWIGQRAANVQSQLPAQATLSIANAPANGMLTAATSVALNGTAPWSAGIVEFTGPGGAIRVDFSTINNWNTIMPLLLGTNVVTLTTYDVHGTVLQTQSFTVVSTATSGFVDDDTDGLPDAWEETHGLELEATATVAGADPDGDGQSNLAEYLFGTDPRNPGSVATLTASNAGPGQVRLTYQALAGRSYRVTFRDSLTSGPWQTLATHTPINANQMVEVTDTPGAGQSRRFYRLETP